MKEPIPLYEFWKDKATKQNLQDYLIQFFKEEAVKRLMNREDAVALADATDLVNEAFEHMDTMFQAKRKPKNIINEAR